MNILEVKNLTVKYNDKIVLNNINLTASKGDFIGIVGCNGSGKTTLIKYILGLLKSECISKNSKLVKKDILNENGNISYVSQNTIGVYKMFPAKVEEIILMGLLSKKKSLFYTKEDKERAKKLMEDLGILSLKNKKIGELSGGEKQKVYIARALISDPQLLVLDEPLSAIDEESQEKIYNIIHRANNNGTVIIMISHDIDEIVKHANKIVFLDNELRYFGDTKGYVECHDCKGEI